MFPLFFFFAKEGYMYMKNFHSGHLRLDFSLMSFITLYFINKRRDAIEIITHV